jgi:hypothetical protein
MAYDEFIADRIRQVFRDKNVVFTERNMMGGRIFFVDDKMSCGIHIDKKYGDTLLMCRIGETAYGEAIEREHTLPMDFTGRPMRGFLFVTPEGFDMDEDLEYWIQKCIDFNPLAQASKKRKV